MQTSKREANFELLRIMAMMGVVCNHFFNDGLDIYSGFKVDVTTTAGMLLYTLLQLLKLVALPAVNCYVLVSGYFLIGKPVLRKQGIWKVWSETWFYSVAIWLVFLCCGMVHFSWHNALGCLLPVCTNEYWFITSYLFLMLLAPFLSMLAMQLSRRQYTSLLVAGFMICFEYPFGRWLTDGNMLVLFVYLFLVGGYTRRFCQAPQSGTKLWVCTLLVIGIMLGYCLGKNALDGNAGFSVYAMAYNGLVLPLSVCVFLLFKNIKIQGRRFTTVINTLASFSLSVYIIHEHPLIRQVLWGKVSEVLAHYSTLYTPLVCIVTCLVVYAACTTVDMVRHHAVKWLRSGIAAWRK